MTKLACIGLLLACLPGCMVGGLNLPADPAQMTVIQRHAKTLPGSRNTVKLHIGDITGQQVLLSIRGRDNKAIVDTRSVRAGDVVPFELGKNRYQLEVIELRNFLVGDDFGVFEISTAPPADAASADG